MNLIILNDPEISSKGISREGFGVKNDELSTKFS